jgi:PAT family beta-lactamase induction signal transducer AmpG
MINGCVGSGRSLPALSDTLVLRFITFTALYVAQGLPLGLIMVAIPAYMAEQGLTPSAIGTFIGISFLPWSLKLVGGALMDRWSFLPMGRRRPWILGAQAGMLVSSIGMALIPSPLEHLAWFTALAFAINLFTAFQDVAIDGLAIEIIPLNQQARANGFMWGASMLGAAASTAAGAWMIDSYGLHAALLTLGILLAPISLIPLLVRERAGERLLPWTTGQAAEAARHLQLAGWKDIGWSLLRVFALPVSLLAIVAISSRNMLSGALNAILPVLIVQQLEWTLIEYSQLKATTSLTAGLIGMLAGGLLIERLGRRCTIIIGELLFGAASLTIGFFFAWDWLRSSIQIFVWVYIVVDTLINIALISVMMGVCWKRVAATQFSLCMALGNLGRSGGAALAGPMLAQLEYPELFLVIGACALVVIIPVCFLDIDRHHQRVSALETLDEPRPVTEVVSS